MFQKITFTVLFLLVGLATAVSQERSAATDNGAMLVSGAASLSSQGYESGDRLNIFALSTGMFSFVSPGLGVGGDITFSSMSRGSSSSTSYGIGPKIGYFFDSGGTTMPFVGAGISYLGASSGGASQDAYRVKLGGGLLIRKDHLGFTIEAAFVLDEYKNASSNTILIGVGFAGLFY